MLSRIRHLAALAWQSAKVTTIDFLSFFAVTSKRALQFFGRYFRGLALVAFGATLGIVTGLPVGAMGTFYLLHEHGPEVGKLAMDYGVRLMGMTSPTALHWEVYNGGVEAINDQQLKGAVPIAKLRDGDIKQADMMPSDKPFPSQFAKNDEKLPKKRR